MKSSFVRVVALAAVCALVGCAGSSDSNAPREITVAGSTALLPLVKQAAADYEALHPQARISVSGGGSGVGITQAAQKGVDIGDSDIPAPGEKELVDHVIAVAVFEVVVNPTIGVTSLTKKQIADVFTGRVTNWKQVGGRDEPITIVNRPRSSGTRATFVSKITNGEQPTDQGLTQDSSGTAVLIVAQTPGAASYVSSGYVHPGQVTAVAIDGVAPTPANVINGTYTFWSFEHMFTNGPPRADAAAFIDFVMHDRSALDAMGFLQPSRLKPRTGGK